MIVPILSRVLWTSELILFSATESFERSRWLGAFIAVAAFSFAAWQYFVQTPRSKRPEAYFDSKDEKGFAFFKRQAFRRRQLAILAGLASAFMFVGCYSEQPISWALSWLGALFFGVWTIALACVDAISIRLKFEDELSRDNSERILLKYQIDKFKREAEAKQKDASEKTDESKMKDVSNLDGKEKRS